MRTSPDSSSAFSPPFEFPVPRSRQLAWLVAAVHILAALPALILELPLAARLLWLAIIAGVALRSLQAKPVTRLRLGLDQVWELEFDQGEVARAVLVSWFSQRWLCVLRFRGCDGMHAVVLPADILAPEQHRRLRVLLGIQRRAGAEVKTLAG